MNNIREFFECRSATLFLIVTSHSDFSFLWKKTLATEILNKKCILILDEKQTKLFTSVYTQNQAHYKILFFFWKIKRKHRVRERFNSCTKTILLLLEGLVCLVRNKNAKLCFGFHSFVRLTTKTITTTNVFCFVCDDDDDGKVSNSLVELEQ